MNYLWEAGSFCGFIATSTSSEFNYANLNEELPQRTLYPALIAIDCRLGLLPRRLSFCAFFLETGQAGFEVAIG